MGNRELSTKPTFLVSNEVCQDKGDFYSAFKSLTESFGGICFAKFGTYPVLAWLIEGPRRPNEMVDGECLHLSL